MDLKLVGKTALVTGSTVGIGYAIAEQLFHEGASVIINGRTESRVAAAVTNLRTKVHDNQGRVHSFVGDLSSAVEIERLTQAFTSVDILINNLGVFEARDYFDLRPSDWHNMLNTNLVSGAQLSSFYLPKMKAKNWGRIIFIASEAGVNIPPDMIHYGVSKAAQIALSRGLSELTKGTAVTVNSVLPGPTKSEGVDKFLKDVIGTRQGNKPEMEREFLNQMRPTSLIQRFSESEEVAALVTYLASERSSATNGAAIRVEGGLLRGVL